MYILMYIKFMIAQLFDLMFNLEDEVGVEVESDSLYMPKQRIVYIPDEEEKQEPVKHWYVPYKPHLPKELIKEWKDNVRRVDELYSRKGGVLT